MKESVENMAKDLSSSPLQLNGVGARMYRCHHITDSTHLNVKANQAFEYVAAAASIKEAFDALFKTAFGSMQNCA